MMYMFFDPVFLLFAIPGLILSGLATIMTKSTFAKYSRVRASSGVTGAQAASRLLAANGLDDVEIEKTGGFLSDHYDPRTRTLRLSPDVYESPSLSAIGVACHEAGHALQHAAHFAPLRLRSALVPITNIGSSLSYFFILGGLIFHAQGLILIGAVLFGAAVLFSIVTLPVEWDASARAKKWMVNAGIVSSGEGGAAAKVLNAAFLTYVAAAVSSILMLLYYLMRAGVLGGGDD